MYKQVLAIACLAAGLLGAASAADLEKGKASYGVCAACHGADGAANKSVNAPAIGGLPAYYTTRQLEHFKAGIRGADAKDTYGAQMRPMAMTLADSAAVENVAAYVETLSSPKPEATLEGDVEKGKAAYATCAACHGVDGAGNEAMDAPPLAGQADWYIARQLQAYKSGLRGTHKNDTLGARMRPMAMTLASDEAVRDVAAYLATLD